MNSNIFSFPVPQAHCQAMIFHEFPSEKDNWLYFCGNIKLLLNRKAYIQGRLHKWVSHLITFFMSSLWSIKCFQNYICPYLCIYTCINVYIYTHIIYTLSIKLGWPHFQSMTHIMIIANKMAKTNNMKNIYDLNSLSAYTQNSDFHQKTVIFIYWSIFMKIILSYVQNT